MCYIMVLTIVILRLVDICQVSLWMKIIKNVQEPIMCQNFNLNGHKCFNHILPLIANPCNALE